MRKRERPDRTRDALVVACGCIIGMAFTIEMKFMQPDNPAAAMFTVLGAALVSTAVTLHLSRR